MVRLSNNRFPASFGHPSSGYRKAWPVALLTALALVALLAFLLSACGGPTSTTRTSATGKRVSGGTVTFAEGAGTAPNYIFPLYSVAYYGVDQTEFSTLMYPPLYWFGKGKTLDLNTQLSLAYPPVYSNHNRTVTIRLKPGIRWSDGKPLTSRDVQFWINLLKANPTEFGPYVPGEFPDNLASASYPNATTVVLHLTGSFNPDWFTNTGLAEITPMPQHAWDRTSLSGPVGNYDLTKKGATAVYNFLNNQAKHTASYSTSPLWKVVDGAFHLSQITSNGQLTFVPNHRYFGPKPHIAKLVELPYTSAAAENDALLSNSVDYGYLSSTDTSEIPRLKRQGYRLALWPIWGVNYLYVNYTNPATAPFMKQQYVRVAMQELVNQPLLVRKIFHGYAYPSYGPVPDVPLTSFVAPSERHPFYKYDPSHAIAALRSHGWKVVPNGTSTCIDPARCGPGIKRGMGLRITTIVPSGYPDTSDMLQVLKSSMAVAGIDMTLVSIPTDSIGGLLTPCKAGSPCKWGLLDYNIGYYWFPAPYPDGGPAFGTGAAAYEGTAPYSQALDRMIARVRTLPASQALSGLYKYEKYVQEINPNIWIPTNYAQISLIKDNLHGVLPQNPMTYITPQLWYLTK